MYPINLRVWGVEKLVREFSKITNSTSGESKGGVRSVGSGSSATGESSTSSSETSLEMEIQILYSLHFFPGKYLSSQL
jgi:hypothetical protein